MANGSGEGLTIPDGDSEDQALVDPEHLPDTLMIDMVRLGRGCYSNCLSCGAFEGMDPAGRRIQTISQEQLEKNLLQEIPDYRSGTRLQLIELFASVVTSGVDMEPLDSNIFNQAAELICKLSEGRSRMAAISHGVGMYETSREGSSQFCAQRGQAERLSRLNDLMMEDVVPLFVLSMDAARAGGVPGRTARKHHKQVCEMENPNADFMKTMRSLATQSQRDEGIPEFGENTLQWSARLARVRNQQIKVVREKVLRGEDLDEKEKLINEYIKARDNRRKAVIEINARGYAQTLNMLLPAIMAGKRVTISLQGDNNRDSLAYHGLAREILQRTLDLLTSVYGLTTVEVRDLLGRVEVTPPRIYAPVGRARNLLGVSEPVDDCPVIPDPTFVRTLMREHAPRVTRGMIDTDGSLMVQSNRPRHGYPDTVAPPPENTWAKVALSVREGAVNSGGVVALPLGGTSIGKAAGESEG